MNHLDEITLNEYLDHALDKSARVEAESHLQTCANCRAKLEELRMLFTELEELPEACLEHDLTSAVLAHLPREKPVKTWTWTRTLAAQLGVVVGFVLWLGMQIVPLMHIPQLGLPKLPTIEVQSLFVRLLSVKFPIPEFRFPVLDFQLPGFSFQLPTLDIQPPTTLITVLALSALILWVVGNAILLRSRQEVES